MKAVAKTLVFVACLLLATGVQAQKGGGAVVTCSCAYGLYPITTVPCVCQACPTGSLLGSASFFDAANIPAGCPVVPPYLVYFEDFSTASLAENGQLSLSGTALVDNTTTKALLVTTSQQNELNAVFVSKPLKIAETFSTFYHLNVENCLNQTACGDSLGFILTTQPQLTFSSSSYSSASTPFIAVLINLLPSPAACLECQFPGVYFFGNDQTVAFNSTSNTTSSNSPNFNLTSLGNDIWVWIDLASQADGSQILDVYFVQQSSQPAKPFSPSLEVSFVLNATNIFNTASQYYVGFVGSTDTDTSATLAIETWWLQNSGAFSVSLGTSNFAKLSTSLYKFPFGAVSRIDTVGNDLQLLQAHSTGNGAFEFTDLLYPTSGFEALFSVSVSGCGSTCSGSMAVVFVDATNYLGTYTAAPQPLDCFGFLNNSHTFNSVVVGLNFEDWTVGLYNQSVCGGSPIINGSLPGNATNSPFNLYVWVDTYIIDHFNTAVMAVYVSGGPSDSKPYVPVFAIEIDFAAVFPSGTYFVGLFGQTLNDALTVALPYFYYNSIGVTDCYDSGLYFDTAVLACASCTSANVASLEGAFQCYPLPTSPPSSTPSPSLPPTSAPVYPTFNFSDFSPASINNNPALVLSGSAAISNNAIALVGVGNAYGSLFINQKVDFPSFSAVLSTAVACQNFAATCVGGIAFELRFSLPSSSVTSVYADDGTPFIAVNLDTSSGIVSILQGSSDVLAQYTITDINFNSNKLYCIWIDYFYFSSTLDPLIVYVAPCQSAADVKPSTSIVNVTVNLLDAIDTNTPYLGVTSTSGTAAISLDSFQVVGRYLSDSVNCSSSTFYFTDGSGDLSCVQCEEFGVQSTINPFSCRLTTVLERAGLTKGDIAGIVIAGIIVLATAVALSCQLILTKKPEEAEKILLKQAHEEGDDIPMTPVQ